MKEEWIKYEPIPPRPLLSNIRWKKVLSLPLKWMVVAYKWFLSGAPDQMSPAKVIDYFNCPQKYRYTRVDKKKGRPSPHLTFYKAAHGSIIEFHKTLQSNPQATVEDMLRVYQGLWETEGFTGEEEEKLFYDRGVQIIRTFFPEHHGKKPPDELRTVVEVKISGVPLKATVDAIEKIAPNHWRITMYKTGQRVFSVASLAADIKSQITYLMLKTKWPKIKLDAQYFYLAANISVPFQMRHEELDNALEVIQDAAKGIGNNEFSPKASHLCGWCDFQVMCPHWGGYITDRTRFRLSYSKMSCYLNCPRNYKFIYVDRVPPQPRNFFSIGTSLHNTMEEFYMYDGIFKQPSFDYLVELFKENWLNAGYKDEEDEKTFFESGLKQIRDYYITEVEGKFRKAYLVEPFFELPVGEKGVMVGFQDRIQKNDDGTYEVLDYKTEPKVRTQAEVDEDLQLTVYYWACIETFKITPTRLTLLFTQFKQRVSTVRTPEHIPKLFAHVNGVVETILQDMQDLKDGKDTAFAPKINKYCSGCDHLHDCPKKPEIIAGLKSGKFLHKLDEKDIKPAPPAAGPLDDEEKAEQEKEADKNLSLLALEKDKTDSSLH